MQRTGSKAGQPVALDLLLAGNVSRSAFAVAKHTYRLGPKGWERTGEPAEDAPLEHDFFDDENGPTLVPGTDFWPHKRATDVVVQGAAHAPDGVPTERVEVSVSVGERTKRAVVFGHRRVEYLADGRVRFGAPEPFVEMPLDWAHCYGGVDFRVLDPELAKEAEVVQALATHDDHPGLYPRNPFGKGYIVEPGALEGVRLPEIEDPDDLLTPERFLVGDPRQWWRQPLPWCFDWVHPMMFPRYVYFDPEEDAWYPAPQDERMPEVRRRFLMPRYRDDRDPSDFANPAFFQEASHGMVFADLVPGTPIVVRGMHPERREVTFTVPEPPHWEWFLEDEVKRARPALHHIVVRPGDEVVHVVWGSQVELPRAYVPGIHKRIPVGVRIDGHVTAYEAPALVRDRIEQGLREQGT